MISRYGRYSGGQRKALVETAIGNELILSDSALRYYNYNVIPFDSFEYTQCKGIWDISTPEMFPKPESKVVTSGLTYPLFAKGYDWTSPEQAYIQYTINIARYANKSARVVFRFDNNGFNTSDYQIDLVNVSGTSYDFENTGHSWQTTTTSTINYSAATWSTLAVGTTNGRWNVDTAGTPTVGAANTAAASGSYYVYAESTGMSTTTNYFAWLRSPVIALGATPTLSFYLCRFVSGPYITVYLDIQ